MFPNAPSYPYPYPSSKTENNFYELPSFAYQPVQVEGFSYPVTSNSNFVNPSINQSPFPNPPGTFYFPQYQLYSPVTQKRCKKCNRYYKEEENESTSCRYHPGSYKSVYQSKIAAGTYSIWSCCKDAEQSSPGCKIGYHLECRQTTAVLSQIPTVDKADLPEKESEGPLIDLNFEESGPSQTQKRTISSHTVLEFDDKVVEKDQKKFIKHFVKMDDTLQGIALRYDITVQELKSVNQLSKDLDLWTRVQLMIPYKGQKLCQLTEEEKERQKNAMKKRMVQRFKRSMKVGCDSEAEYYLESCNYNYEEAVKEYRMDLEWESSTKLK